MGGEVERTFTSDGISTFCFSASVVGLGEGGGEVLGKDRGLFDQAELIFREGSPLQSPSPQIRNGDEQIAGRATTC